VTGTTIDEMTMTLQSLANTTILHPEPSEEEEATQTQTLIEAAKSQPGYLRFLTQLHAVWQAPRVTVTFSDLCATFPTPLRAKSTVDANGHVRVNVPNIISTIQHWAMLPARIAAAKLGISEASNLYALNHVSGVIRPGEMTLVLAPPGHGQCAHTLTGLRAIASPGSHCSFSLIA
jgi:hypothetical protein